MTESTLATTIISLLTLIYLSYLVFCARDLLKGCYSDMVDPKESSSISPGSLWTYKGDSYRVDAILDNHLIQFEDEWHTAVRYRNEPSRGLVFYRALPEFQRKFVPTQ